MVLPLAVVLFLGIAWTIYWFFASFLARDTFAERRAELARAGMELSCASERWGGFPFRFEYTCVRATFSSARSAAVETGSLEAVAQAYDPWHIILLIDGPTRLRHPSGVDVTAAHGRVLASLSFRQRSEPEITIELPGLRVPGIIDAASILVSTRPEGPGLHGIAISAKGLHHQRPGLPALDLDAANLVGTLQPSRNLHVDNVVLQVETVTWSGTGDITLDDQKRIAGTLHTQTNDLDGLLAIIEPHIEMADSQRQTFRSVLGLLGKEAKADIIARDGELFIGPFKVANLLPLD